MLVLNFIKLSVSQISYTCIHLVSGYTIASFQVDDQYNPNSFAIFRPLPDEFSIDKDFSICFWISLKQLRGRKSTFLALSKADYVMTGGRLTLNRWKAYLETSSENVITYAQMGIKLSNKIFKYLLNSF